MCLRKNLEEVAAPKRNLGGVGGGKVTKSSKNSDKRKEQSRNAARSRREKEGHLYNELASVLPLPSQSIQQLDKASIMRLAIADLEVRAVFETGLTKRIKGSGGSKLDQEMDEYHMKALDGFLLVVNTDGRVIYTSENIATFLGHPQCCFILGRCKQHCQWSSTCWSSTEEGNN